MKKLITLILLSLGTAFMFADGIVTSFTLGVDGASYQSRDVEEDEVHFDLGAELDCVFANGFTAGAIATFNVGENESKIRNTDIEYTGYSKYITVGPAVGYTFKSDLKSFFSQLLLYPQFEFGEFAPESVKIGKGTATAVNDDDLINDLMRLNLNIRVNFAWGRSAMRNGFYAQVGLPLIATSDSSKVRNLRGVTAGIGYKLSFVM
ncbi:MAG: hypothetical protein MJ176_04875 [Treponema sp.]|nr:hypothetical protein [Treponema sp.]